VLRKKRRDGKSAPLQPLTKIQHIYIGRLIEKYGEDYKV
jgi:nucleolar protein 16